MTRWDSPKASEAQEQAAVVGFCSAARVPVFAVPNGGYRTDTEGANLKRQGVMPGVPDLCVPVMRGGFGALFIEMKTRQGRPSHEQAAWVSLLRRNGYAAEVCHGADEAIKAIREYMGLEARNGR